MDPGMNSQIIYVDPEELVLGPNLRFADPRIDEMVRDLIVAGRQLQPIGIDPEKKVLFGFRRAAALKKIKQCRMVPEGHPLNLAACVEIQAPDAENRIRIQILENTARINLTPIEEAQIIHHLSVAGYKIETAAEMFRRSKSWASQRLALLRLPLDVQAMIPDKISPYEGYLLSQMDERTMRRRIAAMMDAAPKRHDLSTARRRDLLRDLESRPVNGALRPIVEALVGLLRGKISIDEFLQKLEEKVR